MVLAALKNKMDSQRFYRLNGGVQHYAWGESAVDGPVPYIAQLLGQEAGDAPWAELWLGAHPTLPSTLENNGADGTAAVTLAQAIAQGGAQWLGQGTYDANAEHALPFLLKILACSRPLSIQSHPDEPTAIRLHQEHPELYPDAHDKAEIIIAVKPFQAMAGFRKIEEVVATMESLESCHNWLKLWQNGADGTSLRGACQVLFDVEAVRMAALLSEVEREIRSAGHVATPAESLFLRLIEHYPGDRGTLFAFLLNYIQLQPGEALYLEPNTPHAYLNGVGVECMTNSDNVIRAGLTPKAIDVPTLFETVNFQRTGMELMPIVESNADYGFVREYVPPTKNFRLTILEDAELRLCEVSDSIGIFVVLEGEALLTTPQGEVVAPAGSAWVRPAALKDGAIEPTMPGTKVVWAQTGF